MDRDGKYGLPKPQRCPLCLCGISLPGQSAPFHVHFDASGQALGATLSQDDGTGRRRRVTCTLRKLTPAKRNYTTHERELLALVDAMRRWRHYLLGGKTIAYTDNVSIKYLKTMSNLSPRQVRWLLGLQEYDLELQHIP